MVTVPAPRLSPAAGLAIKLWALLWMFGDHLDQVLGQSLGIHAAGGRIVFPLFAALVAFNLTRADPSHMARVVLPRMLWCGLAALPPYVLLFGWYPLNVMFTLAAGVGVVTAWQLGRPGLAALIGLVASVLVDYLALGVAAVVVPWAMLRAGYGLGFATLVASALVVPFAGSAWPLLAAPTVCVFSLFRGDAPRWKWLFYAVYPLHLYALAAMI
ncbi:MAG: hypothetical protein GX772_10250 [Alcaligenaceae bacterium]|nr:hypothetical protein [Alcaligenaceae bacterium]